MARARAIKGLDCEDSFRRSSGKILRARFEEMMAQSEAALDFADIEGVHDMRVASRRLRAALEMCSPILRKRRVRPIMKEIKSLADTLGEVRDLDVMIGRFQHDSAGRSAAERLVLADLIDELEVHRVESRRKLVLSLQQLESSDFARRFLRFVVRETT